MQRRNVRHPKKANTITQAYEKCAENNSNLNDSSKIYELLQKISNQLDSLSQIQQPSQNTANNEIRQLNEIFGQILNKNTTNNNNANNASMSANSNNSNTNAGTSSQVGKQKVVVQTAAQMLADAQYELSNELEASLQKLKTVIQESEKIANKINNLLSQSKSK